LIVNDTGKKIIHMSTEQEIIPKNSSALLQSNSLNHGSTVLEKASAKHSRAASKEITDMVMKSQLK